MAENTNERLSAAELKQEKEVQQYLVNLVNDIVQFDRTYPGPTTAGVEIPAETWQKWVSYATATLNAAVQMVVKELAEKRKRM